MNTMKSLIRQHLAEAIVVGIILAFTVAMILVPVFTMGSMPAGGGP